MKETIKALAAGLGCTPMLAVVLFLAGAAIGQAGAPPPPAPPGWFIFPAVLFPVCFGLFMHAVVIKANSPRWLEQWRTSRRRVVGHSDSPLSLEDAWLQTQLKQQASQNFIKSLLENQMVWGWAALLTFLPLATLCLWYGLALAQR